MKRMTAVLLMLCLLCSLSACRNTGAGNVGGSLNYTDPFAEVADDYDALSAAVYDRILGDFYKAYQLALEEQQVSKRYALMAVAEAKMLGAGVFLPTTSGGGNYEMTRIAPHTNTSILWGADTYRFHDRIATSQPLKAEDSQHLQQVWQEQKGTGDYEDYVIEYLSDKGYTMKDTLNVYFETDPKVWDALATSNGADSRILVQTYDGLYEYDMENRLRPALAESHTVSEDGKIYTFKLRRGVQWVDNQGRAVAELTADDFVAGMQHMMDAMGGLEYLVQPLIVGADAYIKAETRDFSTVGVKALDKYTLQYTLTAPTSYFMTMLGHGVFAPLSRSFYESMGGGFGDAFDATAQSYRYGKGPDSIAYCGPFVITSFTSHNSIVCQENAAYWNRGDNHITRLTYLYNDGTDEQKPYHDFFAGVVDSMGMTDARMRLAQEKGTFDLYAQIAPTNATTYCGFFNVRRAMFQNFNDASVGISPKTEADRVRTGAAMLNRNFRLALAMSIDRGAYNAQSVGEALKYSALTNSYTPAHFVSLTEETTVELNGVPKTYPEGTMYGQIVQDQLDADGVGLTVWNGTTGTGFDGWYQPEEAARLMDAAVQELAAEGIEISAENPILLDLPYRSDNQVNTNMKNAMKQSIEAATGGRIRVNLIAYATRDHYLNATYWFTSGNEANFDLNDGSGWGPDYGDPKTYLDTMLPDYAGYMTKCLGLF